MQRNWVRVLTTLMTLGVMGMIFCFSMEPAAKSDASSGAITVWVADRVTPEWRELPVAERQSFYDSMQYVIRKCAHFTEFAMLGFCLRLCLESWLGRRKWLLPLSWAGGTFYAMTDEWHQLLIDGRSGQWTDVLIDSAGVFTGTLIAAGLLLLVRHKRRRG